MKTAKKHPQQLINFLVLLLIGLCMASGCVPAGQSRSDRSGLAVLKFVNATSEDHAAYFQPWEYGIAAMLATDIEKTAMFNIVDRDRLNDIIREQQLQVSGLVDRKTAVAIGRLIAARYILTGTFLVVGNDLKIMAQVFSVEQGIQLDSITVAGKTANFFLVEKELFSNVSKSLRIMLDEAKQARIMHTIETKSVEASLRNYAGEMALMKADEMNRLGRKKETAALRDNARRQFREALEYDPEYERAKKNLAKLVMAVPMTL